MTLLMNALKSVTMCQIGTDVYPHVSHAGNAAFYLYGVKLDDCMKNTLTIGPVLFIYSFNRYDFKKD
ncbi:MAG: hypothetical protein A2076_15255 [Geobacteraceae bacterium GWC2_53_11]|nr:MAG: hypothetical protein A2076_15255 [Geobacteraceae bacterium GWC2_53_11]